MLVHLKFQQPTRDSWKIRYTYDIAYRSAFLIQKTDRQELDSSIY